nr:PREDICTED: elongation of very long chain fatty acids protein AAEL008004-like isoform X2 [Megachile rotundata]
MIIVTYIYFSVSAGPRYMRDKKPYQLRNVMIAYNFIQVLLSIYLVREGLLGGWGGQYSFRCQPVDYSNSPQALRMARAVHSYYLCKLVELLDTVFFVLRKKQRQISFLHVYHHALMPFCSWVGIRYVPGGHSTLLGVINSFIHIIMYSYYMLTSIGPHMYKYVWWKKYLTTLQLIQFSIILVHNLQLFFIDCNYPKIIAFLLSLNSIIFIYMFGKFYITNYTKNRSINEKSCTNGAIKNKNE